jgi:hypothetical protein
MVEGYSDVIYIGEWQLNDSRRDNRDQEVDVKTLVLDFS